MPVAPTLVASSVMPGHSPNASVSTRARQRRSSVGDATRRRIMAEAERLIGQQGVDAVSIRDITSASGVDTSAVHYHFGSKHHLIVTILEERLQQLDAVRGPLLDDLVDEPAPTIRDVAAALVRPAAQRKSAKVPNAFIRSVMDHAEYAAIVESAIDPDISRYMIVLQRIYPEVPSGFLVTRLLLSITLVQGWLTNTALGRRHWLQKYRAGRDDQSADALVDFIVAAFDGP